MIVPMGHCPNGFRCIFCSLYSLTIISSYQNFLLLSPLAMESGAGDSHWMDEFPVPLKQYLRF